MKTHTFVGACREYFGFLEGQGPVSFLGEIKALTAADRVYYKALLNTVGYQFDGGDIAAAA